MKKSNPIDDLLAKGILYMGHVAAMGKQLEKERKTKIVFAEICLVADNGNAVYKLWATDRTKRNFPKLAKFMKMEGKEAYKEIKDALANDLPYSFLAKIVSSDENI
jgi:hypothetical protein